jgi:hypothetical protein
LLTITSFKPALRKTAQFIATPPMQREIMTWVAPAIGIPGLRYFQDDKEQRKQLFIRDASTYTLGALTFLALKNGVLYGLEHSKTILRKIPSGETRHTLAFMVGLAGNILYAGIGAIYLSQKFGKSSSETTQFNPLSSTQFAQTKLASSTVPSASAPIANLTFFAPQTLNRKPGFTTYSNSTFTTLG